MKSDWGNALLMRLKRDIISEKDLSLTRNLHASNAEKSLKYQTGLPISRNESSVILLVNTNGTREKIIGIILAGMMGIEEGLGLNKETPPPKETMGLVRIVGKSLVNLYPFIILNLIALLKIRKKQIRLII